MKEHNMHFPVYNDFIIEPEDFQNVIDSDSEARTPVPGVVSRGRTVHPSAERIQLTPDEPQSKDLNHISDTDNEARTHLPVKGAVTIHFIRFAGRDTSVPGKYFTIYGNLLQPLGIELRDHDLLYLLERSDNLQKANSKEAQVDTSHMFQPSDILPELRNSYLVTATIQSRMDSTFSLWASWLVGRLRLIYRRVQQDTECLGTTFARIDTIVAKYCIGDTQMLLPRPASELSRYFRLQYYNMMLDGYEAALETSNSGCPICAALPGLLMFYAFIESFLFLALAETFLYKLDHRCLDVIVERIMSWLKDPSAIPELHQEVRFVWREKISSSSKLPVSDLLRLHQVFGGILVI